MFTGIIEEIGIIKSITVGANSIIIEIKVDSIFSDLKLGDSVAVNGVCLTVKKLRTNSFIADIMHETIDRSSLKGLNIGSKVNLERAMLNNGRFGGHIVSGHIDGVGKIISIKKDDNAYWYTINTKDKILHYIVEKGSITIDGISLTVANVTKDYFRVSIIPHTLNETILKDKKVGDKVNLENDIVGKYIEKFIFSNISINKNENSNITMNLLSKNGFI